jgi:hypothetical protein
VLANLVSVEGLFLLDSTFKLLSHKMEGVRQLWGLVYAGSNPIHEVLTSGYIDLPKASPPNIITSEPWKDTNIQIIAPIYC